VNGKIKFMEKLKNVSIVKKEESSVDNFISQAISQSLPVETMEKLFALREKAKAEFAKEAFVSAMAKFQAECPVIKKEKIVKSKDGTIRYKYAPLDMIVSQVKKPLGSNDLFYSFKEEKDKDFATAICTITHKFGHSESSSFQIPIGTEDYMNDAQKYGARMTFAKRYAFCNSLGILTGDEDTDANMPTDKSPKSKKSQIVIALRTLGEDTKTKESCDDAVKKLTQLNITDENIDEIIGRLKVLIDEKNDENTKI
jgi:hypothetical protein